MLFAIDIGNSNTVLGLFEDKKLVQNWRITTNVSKTVDEYAILIHDLFRFANIHFYDISDIIISSVVPPLVGTMTDLCENYFKRKPFIVGPGIKTGMPILYDNPKEVGADRIVNAVAAYEKYKDALIIVDFGTATTFDYITAKGEYQGGAIAPGIGISLEALFARASKLPRVEFAKPPQIIARNTVNSIQSGLFYGYAALVDGIVDRMKQESKTSPQVIATGGFASQISQATESIDHVDSDLTLDGLQIIYERNK